MTDRPDDIPESDEITEEELNERIIAAQRILDYENLTELPEMEKELKKLEISRRKSNFEKRFNRLKTRVAKTDEKLKKEGWTERDILRRINNILEARSYLDTESPDKTLNIALREYKLLKLFIRKLQDTITNYHDELNKKYGLEDTDEDAIFDLNKYIRLKLE